MWKSDHIILRISEIDIKVLLFYWSTKVFNIDFVKWIGEIKNYLWEELSVVKFVLEMINNKRIIIIPRLIWMKLIIILKSHFTNLFISKNEINHDQSNLLLEFCDTILDLISIILIAMSSVGVYVQPISVKLLTVRLININSETGIEIIYVNKNMKQFSKWF